MVMTSFVLIDGTVFALYAVACALWHELWHIITLKIVGGGVGIFALRGFSMKLNTTVLSYKDELKVTVAGPIASFVGFLVFAAVCYFDLSKHSLFIMVSNLFIFLINIIPIFPLDGGRAVYCFFNMRFEKDTASKLTRIISLIFLLPLSVLSVIILVRTGYNLSLLMITAFLVISIIGVKDI